MRTLVCGEPASTIATYESIVALHVAAADGGLSCGSDLAAEAEQAAAALIRGETFEMSVRLRQPISAFASWNGVPRVPAGIGVQGVEYADAVSLADRWLAGYRQDADNVVVVGLRTGGAYLAPIISARLRACGVNARFLSVRPGQDLPRLASRTSVLLVDDPPLTGSVITATLQAFGASSSCYVLAPVFDQESRDSVGRRTGGVVVSLDRTLWASVLRLEPEAVSASFGDDIEWNSGNKPVKARSYVPGYGNSALTPWPSGRRRAAPRAAFEVDLTDGSSQRMVARWVSPGIFGGPARLAAAAAFNGVRPAVHGIGRSIILTEFIDPVTVQDTPDLSARMSYVRQRALSTRSHEACFPDHPDATLRLVADSLRGHGLTGVADDLVAKLRCVTASLPDNRCQQDKWATSNNQLIKFGGLDHALRRDNQLMSSLIDLAALACSEPHEPLERFAEALRFAEDDTDSSLLTTALQIAILYYSVARGTQLPRMYTAAQSTTLAIEAINTQQRVNEVLEALGVPSSEQAHCSNDVGIRIDLLPARVQVTGTLHPASTFTPSIEYSHAIPATVGILEDSASRFFFYHPTGDAAEYAGWLRTLRRSQELDWLGAPTFQRRIT